MAVKNLLPGDVIGFLTTSRNKEGISINNEDIHAMFIEAHTEADIIQMAGRLRNPVDVLYVVVDSNGYWEPESRFEKSLSKNKFVLRGINSEFKTLCAGEGYALEEEDGELRDPIYQNETLREYIDYIHEEYPYVRFDYSSNSFAYYEQREISKRYDREQNRAFDRAKRWSCDLAALVKTWFPEAKCSVSRACLEHGRDMWMVLQVNSHQQDVFISEKQLRFQANCALAFGARMIIWACYCAGWWYNHVLDREGNQTEQYEKLRRVNARLHNLGENYMKYRYEETCFVGRFTAQELFRTDKAAVDMLDTAQFKGLHAGNAKLLVGRMNACDGKGEALFVASADDPSGVETKIYQVTFACEAGCVYVMDGEKESRLEKNGNGLYSVQLSSCEGILVKAEEK